MGWGLLFFVIAQLLFNILMEHWQPAIRDPEFGTKLAYLQYRLREEPDRPLVLTTGSSRSALGFRPTALKARGVTVFNFSLKGAGPLLELLTLHRLLEQGIHPSAIILEMFIPGLKGDTQEANGVLIQRLSWHDLQVCRRYAANSDYLLAEWLVSRLVPCYSHRFGFLSWYAPDWLSDQVRHDGWRDMDRSGWLPYTIPNDALALRGASERSWREYAALLAEFRVSKTPVAMLREFLTRCQQEQIAVEILIMPEGAAFQRWYPAETSAEVEVLCQALGRDFDVPVVNARNWFDESAFFDNHHLFPQFATLFTQRFGREGLPPLLARLRDKSKADG